VAEGIENTEQLAYLADRGCDLMQGYYFDRPLYPEDVPEALRRDYADDINRAIDTHSGN
jgi:EAL domain-containing protein (putative c-di-GMP-specific phosphodiesterase class I)